MKNSYDRHALELWTNAGYSKDHLRSFDETTRGEFQTPPDIAAYMVSLLPKEKMNVLEPTPGKHRLVRALRNAGHFRITAPKDYFLLPRRRKFDAVIMNPPFSSRYVDLQNAPVETHKIGMRMGYWFLTDCMRRAPVIIALMPWFTITDSDVRMRQLKKWGLRSVTSLPRRTFRFARIQTVVLHLQKGYTGSTELIVYDLKDQHQTKLL